jgi:hypothetical protein
VEISDSKLLLKRDANVIYAISAGPEYSYSTQKDVFKIDFLEFALLLP